MKIQRGFTLIEMVIALAILSMSLTALYQSFEQALARVRHDGHLSEATLLARSMLARAGSEWPLVPGTSEGDWENYHFRLIQVPLAAPALATPYGMSAMQASVSVTWQEPSGEHSMALSTVKLLHGDSP